MKGKIVVAVFLAAAVLAGCGASTPGSFDVAVPISVVAREDGSGTRGAFTELFGLVEETPSGSSDMTTMEAIVINNTAVMMNTVQSDPYAIGYLSFGSLNSAVKAVKIDGVSATTEHILDGRYPISRPFLVATPQSPSPAAQDFISFILSTEGQAIVSTNGYIPLQNSQPYSGGKPGGKTVVAGSSSVTPLMEKLKEAYLTLNPAAEIEIQQSDSSTGIAAVSQGICDIGMASRQLKPSELDLGLVPVVVAMDGIAVIVNPENPCDNLTREQVRAIFSGQATVWNQV